MLFGILIERLSMPLYERNIMVVSITKENYETEIEQSSLPVVIDFYATWCGPCQQMAPIFEELEKDFLNKYKFAKANIDEARDIAVKHSVSSVPTFVFIKNGSVVGKETGFMNKDAFKSKIESLLG
jgi:thioredoxin 1